MYVAPDMFLSEPPSIFRPLDTMELVVPALASSALLRLAHSVSKSLLYPGRLLSRITQFDVVDVAFSIIQAGLNPV